jgi:hypothetical protein
MATAAQVLANRANAQHSTGPKTEAGKQTTAQNALRHGLAAKGFLVAEGQEQFFSDLESSLRGSLKPTSPLQEIVFKRVLESAWHLERCRFALVSLAANNNAPEPMLDPHAEAHAARIQKYSKDAENSMYKAMREFSKLKTEDQFRHETFPIAKADFEDPAKVADTPHAISELCNLPKIMNSVLLYRRNEIQPMGPGLTEDLWNATQLLAEHHAAAAKTAKAA